MKKIKGWLLALSLMLFTGMVLLRSAPLQSSPVIVLADEGDSQEEIIDETTEEVDGEEEAETEEEEEEHKMTMEEFFLDADGNGIPDVMEEFYNTNIRDQQIFGVTIGTLIGFLLSVAGQIFMIMKNKNVNNEFRLTNKAALATNNDTKAELKAIKEESERMRLALVESEKQHEQEKALYRETLVKQAEENKLLAKEFKEASNKLAAYSEFEKKMDTLLAIELAKASDPELVQKGIGAQVIKLVKGAE